MNTEWSCGVTPPCYIAAEKWLAIDIPKCASSYLRYLSGAEKGLRECFDLWPPMVRALFNEEGMKRGLVKALRSGRDNRLRFAVWVDPVVRAKSVYKNFCLIEGEKRFVPMYYELLGMCGASQERFVEFVKFAMGASVVEEHIRQQSCYYDLTDVDVIVPIESLDLFMLEKFGVSRTKTINSTKKSQVEFTDSIASELESVYHRDYELFSVAQSMGIIYKPIIL